MAADFSSAAEGRLAWHTVASRAHGFLLRKWVIAAGLTWSILFVVVGLAYELHLFADGALFSYSVAVRDVWAFHWHNISGRLSVYLIAEAPGELYVALSGDPRGGVAVYGFLFFSAQLMGLVATWASDRSTGRVIFTFACASTACFCPLVFGFPTEMWVAHALFWPTLSVCHYARGKAAGSVLVFAMLLALIFTHQAALILAIIIVSTTLLRGTRNPAYRRAAAGLAGAFSLWAIITWALPPDAYDLPMMRRAALHFFDPTILTSYLLVLLMSALSAYGVIFLALLRLDRVRAAMGAALLTAAALGAYWTWFDGSLHGDDRYPMRTVLFIGTAAFGVVAAVHALSAEERLKPPILARLLTSVGGDATALVLAGALVVVTLVHTVETARFVRVWTAYLAAVQSLAAGAASDAALGDAHFVSSSRIGDDANRLSWSSTTQFLSVLVAPSLAPKRLVVNPNATYFWLSCNTATANQLADRAVPVESRRLVRVHACLHR